ncbi:DUF998 domain-containing protein [Mycetocola spongiae]|uniref:DUF998 domain-containing protein n=1 Tax=Mycetocola spongiae TaxID=2859226 RepID=UPI001CF45F6D|nr:DUF998 domain-containing protein [Mycetocola spongiae]UCR88489.1 DUF998 domain-containing protein [Mycetocola spongiae]
MSGPATARASRVLLSGLGLAGSALALAALAGIWLLRLDLDRAVYVSELGGDGAPGAEGFRIALFAVAGAGALLGSARLCALPLDAGPGRRARTLRMGSLIVGWSLLLAGIGFAVAAAYPCTAGCPVPGSLAHTPRDTVHLTAAIAGFALVCLAMFSEAILGREPRDRRIALVSALCVAGIAGIGGLLALFHVAVDLGALCEFIAMSIAIAWCAGNGVLDAIRAGSHRGRSAGGAE